MKRVYETIGNFQLLGNKKGDVVRAHRPSVIEDAHFLGVHIAASPPRAKLLGEVNDEATDDKLVAHLKDGKKVEDFIKAFAPKPEK